MYLKIWKIKQTEKEWWKITLLTHIWLYKDDWTHVKWVAHEQDIIDKLMWAKIDITIPELENHLKPHEIEKIMPKEKNLFDNIWLWK